MEQPRLYTRQYFQLFAALVLHMTGISLQYHFGEYVAHLGGTESTLGWIMGIGMAGSLLVRPRIGSWVDQLGTKPVLLGGTLVAGAAAFAFQLTSNLTVIAGLRIVATLANAVFFTAVAAHTASLAPPRRRAESLGTMGMGGFTGMILGPALGDWIFTQKVLEVSPFTIFFLTAAAAHWAAAGLITTLCRPKLDAGDAAQEPFFRTLRTYWPGTILLVGATFTLAQTIPFLYLERFAEARGIANIRNFYFGYAPAAIALRIIGRRVPERFGRRRTLLVGFVLMAAGFLMLEEVRTERQFLLPAIIMGAGHCFIYPSLIDLGADRLPPARRGMGTSIILGAGDVGFLTGFICWGQLITRVGFAATFQVVSAWMLLVAVVFAWRERTAMFGPGSRRRGGGPPRPEADKTARL